jgi:hypothetical protein
MWGILRDVITQPDGPDALPMGRALTPQIILTSLAPFAKVKFW